MPSPPLVDGVRTIRARRGSPAEATLGCGIRKREESVSPISDTESTPYDFSTLFSRLGDRWLKIHSPRPILASSFERLRFLAVWMILWSSKSISVQQRCRCAGGHVIDRIRVVGIVLFIEIVRKVLRRLLACEKRFGDCTQPDGDGLRSWIGVTEHAISQIT